MKIVLLVIGKTNNSSLTEQINDYLSRINYYNRFEMIEIPNSKYSSSLPVKDLLRKEAELIFNYLNDLDHLVLLDEKGTSKSAKPTDNSAEPAIK